MTVRKTRMSGWNADRELADKFDRYIEKSGETQASVYAQALELLFKVKEGKLEEIVNLYSGDTE